MAKQLPVGRRAKVDLAEQIEIYTSHKDELIEDGHVKPATREIFNVLSAELKMTAKAIHLAVVRNSEEIFGMKYSSEKFEKKSDDEEVNHEIWSCDSWISINLSESEKKLFDCEEVQYFDRKRTVLKQEWANWLFEILVRETGTDCCINFSRSECVNNEFEATGYCAECHGAVLVKSFSNHSLLKVKLTKGSKEHTFKKKRRLTHKRKEYFSDKLSSNFPSNVRNDLASTMPLMDHEPRDLPSQTALKSARFRVLNKSMLDVNCISALRKMKYLPEFEGSIKEIATDPLHVIFWSDYQELWYRRYAVTERTCVSIDATGKIVTSSNMLAGLGLDHIRLPHIFLYLIVAKTSKGVSVPVGQFLSANQHCVLLNYFLETWKNKFETPKETVVDDSAALLKSCVMSFSSIYTVQEYLKKCYKILNGERDELPLSYIRLDISHFVKNLHRLKIFKSVDSRVKQLYLCCIGIIIKCESFDDVKSLVRHMLILANYPHEGCLENGELLPTSESRTKVNRLIRTHDLDFILETTNDSSDLELDFDECDSVTSWIDEIISEVGVVGNTLDLDKSNSAENMYYLPKFTEDLRKLCARLLLWSAVMTKHFGSDNVLASSSNVESNFNRIKHIIMKDSRLPVRVDTFLQKYLVSINGSTKLALANYPYKGNKDEINEVKLFYIYIFFFNKY